MDEFLQRGIRFFNNQEFFECHETLEEAWGPERGQRRVFLQALIHLAVGFYHCERNNPEGASRQVRKGLRKLAAHLPYCEGIDTGRLFREASAALENIEAGMAVNGYPQIHVAPSPPGAQGRPERGPGGGKRLN
jgi:predicted metal-dependent hydrolase